MEHVLLVGPHLATDSTVRLVAKCAGCDVLTTRDSAEGFELFRRHHPQLVIVEHCRDSGQDVELMARVHAESPGSETIVVTEQAGGIDFALRVLSAGALDYLRLPLDPEQLRQALTRARTHREARRAAMRPTILVLEDDELTRNRLVRILDREGYRASSEADGAAGMRAFEKSRHDIILCDLNMPEKNGIEVLREAKANDADVEVILVTGQAEERLVIEAMRGGASSFLCKPIDLDDLFSAVSAALGAQAARRNMRGAPHELALLRELSVRLSLARPTQVRAPELSEGGPLPRLRALIDDVPLSILLVDGAGDVVYANAEARLAGLAQGTLPEPWLRAVEGVTEVFERVPVSPDRELLVMPLRLLSGNADGPESECCVVVPRAREGSPGVHEMR